GVMMGGQGGGMMGGGMGGMGMQQRDTGEELVDLIQTTVAPDSWEENGGPGSIRFFRTNYSVIIRQTAENHEEIADVLRQLGRVNR
ncbi:MAG: hypothetical protein HQ581_17745, partial [Planctomycetes bacterium]|nr:hypothetical protein [Planctomycetota bacterium]